MLGHCCDNLWYFAAPGPEALVSLDKIATDEREAYSFKVIVEEDHILVAERVAFIVGIFLVDYSFDNRDSSNESLCLLEIKIE